FTSGTTISTPITATAASVSVTLTQAGSCVARRYLAGGAVPLSTSPLAGEGGGGGAGLARAPTPLPSPPPPAGRGGRGSPEGGAGRAVSGGMPAAPAFQQVDQRQQGERDQEQHGRQGRSLGVGVLLQPGDDQHRGDLRAVRHVARDEHHRPVLAQGPGE